jgi:hypothetical protein
MITPSVSVIIPTHERARYAVPTIKALLAISGDLEVVVCDTSAQDQITPALTGEPGVERLVLVRPGKPLSVVDNFNTALKAASGKYLTFIGDDDFVSAQIVAVADWAAHNKVDAIKFSFPALYFWPDFHHKTQHDAIAGTLRTSKFGGKVTQHDAKKAALDAMNNLGGGVMDMPRAYAGLISRQLIERIISKYGELFGGVSPDIYSAFLISMEARNCVRIDYPIIIPGASGASTAGLSAKGQHVGALRDNAHIRPFENLVWDQRIPEFYSVPSVWSFSLLKAVEKVGWPTSAVNFPRLYIKCLIFHRPYLKPTLAALCNYVKIAGLVPSIFKLALASVGEGIWIAGKLKQKLFEKMGINFGLAVEQNLEDTASASRRLEEIYSTSENALKLE